MGLQCGGHASTRTVKTSYNPLIVRILKFNVDGPTPASSDCKCGELGMVLGNDLGEILLTFSGLVWLKEFNEAEILAVQMTLKIF